MFRAFWISLGGQFYLLAQLARNVAAPGWSRLWFTLPLFVLIWLGTLLLNILHWLGFLCDELFFRQYRHIAVNRPVFVLGIPRSGTTFLHRTLAKDKRLTSITTWQAIFAPSISERLLFSKLGRLLGKSRRQANGQKRGFFARMEAIHQLDWNEPEEDFLLLWPMQACFLFFLLCPNSRHYWNLGSFDSSLPHWYRNAVMVFYQHCIQKHLYCEGKDKRYLSKNPSFTSLTGSLLKQFPDASVLACYRSPDKAVPSQLSSLEPGLQLLGYKGSFPVHIKTHLLDVLVHYYGLVIHYLDSGQALPVGQTALRSDLQGTLLRVYNFIKLSPEAGFDPPQEHKTKTGKGSNSSHRYSLDEYGLTSTDIQSLFGKHWQKIQLFNNLS